MAPSQVAARGLAPLTPLLDRRALALIARLEAYEQAAQRMRTHCERTGNAGAARLFGKEEGAYRKAVLIAREMLAAAVPDVDFDPTTGSAPL